MLLNCSNTKFKFPLLTLLKLIDLNISFMFPTKLSTIICFECLGKACKLFFSRIFLYNIVVFDLDKNSLFIK